MTDCHMVAEWLKTIYNASFSSIKKKDLINSTYATIIITDFFTVQNFPVYLRGLWKLKTLLLKYGTFQRQ